MEYEELLKKYNEALSYIKKLEIENKNLKKKINKNCLLQDKIESAELITDNNIALVCEEIAKYEGIDENSSNKDKVKLYLSLFKGREDVCARRWESKKTGKSGYTPYCHNDWVEGLCGKKKKIKCSKCQNQNFAQLDERALRKHFIGDEILGLYPIDEEDKCYLIVMDFDKVDWQKEISIVNKLCVDLNIPAYIERSRSGNGGHMWFFFENKISATIARRFAGIILDKAMEKDSIISFNAYDRLIPSQDFLQKDGFGNLISLPLQRSARDNENSVFVDAEFNVIDDQWKYLSEIKKINPLYLPCGNNLPLKACKIKGLSDFL